MDVKRLKMELVRCGLTIPGLAVEMGVSKKLIYSRFKEETSFTQREISQIARILNLDRSMIMDIFFSKEVS